MTKYECIDSKGVKHIIMRLDVIGEPRLFQLIKLKLGGTIHIDGWKIKRTKSDDDYFTRID